MTRASDNDYPSILLTEQGSAPSSPAASHQRLYIRTSDHTLVSVNSSGTVATVGGGGGSLSYQQAKLSADVTMSSANTAYDGPTVTLSAGTWLIVGQLLILQPGSNGGVMDFKLWDGTTAIATTSITAPSSPVWVGPINLACVVVVASGTPVYKMSAYHQSTGVVIKAAAGGGNATGNLASVISAVKII